MAKQTYAEELKQMYRTEIREVQQKQLEASEKLARLYMSTVLVDIWELRLRYPRATSIKVVYKNKCEFEASVICDGKEQKPHTRDHYEGGCFGGVMQAFRIAADALESKNITFSQSKNRNEFCWSREDNSMFIVDYAEATKQMNPRSLKLLAEVVEQLRESFEWKNLYQVLQMAEFGQDPEIQKNDASVPVRHLDEGYLPEEVEPIIPILRAEGIEVVGDSVNRNWEFLWNSSAEHQDGTFAKELDCLWEEKAYNISFYLENKKRYENKQVNAYARIIKKMMRAVGKKYKTEEIFVNLFYSGEIIIRVYTKESAVFDDPIITRTIPQHGGIEYQKHLRKTLKKLEGEGAFVEYGQCSARISWKASGKDFAGLYKLYVSQPEEEYSLSQEYEYYLMVKLALEEGFKKNFGAERISIKVRCNGTILIYGTVSSSIKKFNVKPRFDFKAFGNAKKRLEEEGIETRIDNGVQFTIRF